MERMSSASSSSIVHLIFASCAVVFLSSSLKAKTSLNSRAARLAVAAANENGAHLDRRGNAIMPAPSGIHDPRDPLSEA